MYLSRIPIDMSKRESLRAMNSSSVFHGALESCFEGERTRKLWRIDHLNGQDYILVLSNEKPELSSFCNQFSYDEKRYETKDYNILLNKIKDGTVWRFRLTANPTRSIHTIEGAKRGKVVAHITNDYQKKWLLERAEKNGFEIDESGFDVVEIKWKKFYKKDKNSVTILSVTYEGVLKIKDAELFKEMLVNGIGRGKSYGMGLMTVIR